ncbi:hypothetical protein [Acinetobacter baumannii]|uniref:hypothetical protein n=1 Tax=Acinetobacter baumannii TaxID=470 RepID=UPI000DE79AEE|nr:hypothetical protein [Acinetobacter baumannii]EME4727108.1 hypothetical protein [Acinetobacter baumannii]MDP7924590.1 hypothetical protein [Acinetobacter baumannii]TQF19995.1 hypothetical protein FJU44_17890 [Acinetobacter baumannii]SSQ27670.1 Uncharacterised protein [Acinetobacter baumannii]HCQ9933910.1 hypothetical protein [Acinetobacter baumannii]
MSQKYSFLLLVMAIFGIALVRTGKYIDSFVYAVSIAYLVLFILTHFKPIVINNNDFSGSKLSLEVDEESGK